MEKPKKINSLSGKIETREDALSVIKETAIGFWFLAGLQAAIGFFLAPILLIDAVLIAVLAGVLFWLRSRIAAVLLLVLSSITLVSTILNLAGITQQGGKNLILSIIFTWAAVRAVEATFKLHNQFKNDTAEQPPSEQPLPDE